MRILISAPLYGGVGGVERALMSWLRALEDHHVDLCARRIIPSEFLVDFPHVSVIPDWRFKAPKIRYLNRAWRLLSTAHVWLPRKYDILIQFRLGIDLTGVVQARIKLLNPSGVANPDLESKVDFVMSQAPDGVSLVSDQRKHRVIVPPVYEIPEAPETLPNLPDNYYLTVFNPYSDELKGTDLLYKHAAEARFPIVWCHSSTTNDISDHVHAADNVIHVDNPSQSQLRYLYENCSAYVSFSRSEGYGWAIADALLLSKPIISRHVGVLTNFGEERGLHYYETESELSTLLQNGASSEPEVAYNLSRISPEQSLASLETLLNSFPSH